MNDGRRPHRPSCLAVSPTRARKGASVCRMPFGKHRGTALPEVPTPYLRWVLRNCTDLLPSLRIEIQKEIASRGSKCPAGSPLSRPTELQEALRRWHRQLCLDFHPDRGGSKEAMQAVNEAYGRLRKVLQL